MEKNALKQVNEKVQINIPVRCYRAYNKVNVLHTDGPILPCLYFSGEEIGWYV